MGSDEMSGIITTPSEATGHKILLPVVRVESKNIDVHIFSTHMYTKIKSYSGICSVHKLHIGNGTVIVSH